MNEVMIIDALRTPVGKYGGGLKEKSASDLASVVIRELVERNGIEKNSVDQVITGCVLQNGENAYASRLSMLKAGLEHTTTALTVNRLCGSGLEAINQAAMNIMLGYAGLCIAGGTESMSNAPYLSYSQRWGSRMGDAVMTDGMVTVLSDPYLKYHMGITAENLVKKYNISREEQDTFAFGSIEKAKKAQSEGRFAHEIVPVEVGFGKNKDVIKDDESIRYDVTLEKLSALKPAFSKDGTVTPGNSSSINDGSAFVILSSREKAAELGLKPRARIIAQAVAGVEPEYMGIGPSYAIPLALKRACLELSDMDLVELNEAFAGQAIAVDRDLCFDKDRLNVNGGAVALGHPIGATGAILMTKILYELERRNKRYGLVSLCIGGGQGIATIIDREV